MYILNQHPAFFFLGLGMLLAFSSCVEDDDFSAPEFEQTPPEIEGNKVSLSVLKGILAQNDNGPYTFEDTQDYVEAYVISSDESGNFFRELIVQDKPENPTYGIGVQVDKNPLFTKYDFGRKVYIRLEGLSVGKREGSEPRLGIVNGIDIGRIPEALVEEVILRDTIVAEIIPLQRQLSDLSFSEVNTYVELMDVQFSKIYFSENSSATYAAGTEDSFDGERILESCASAYKLIFSTSTFADFKTLSLPSGSGSVQGVLTRDFRGDFFTFYINSPEAVDMTGERCDPLVFSCGLAASPASSPFIAVDFEDQRTNRPIAIPGWTNYIEAGTEAWEAYSSRSDSSNPSLGISARVRSENSGDAHTISWLITPEIPVETNSKITLEFKTSNSFADASFMEVLYSVNWDGTEEGISSAEWGNVQDAFIVSDEQFFGDWVSSGLVDMSCFDGNGHIAFRYTGKETEDGEFNGVYELDDIAIHVE
ncbi:DUF5689 domain-containing protein [Psychroflexus sediminis]|uniref:DUF5689 domain-containing protein n=1 Tax=Psychroflexus sediminis TaxID=470826 RepID=A0A1G7X4Q3_9FLAO|nr:DUF5689 domain-containing protein [Psychroflexus sediminis]SDG79106.1 hypothetical protein SAMN04488027_10785 [Psychroflexus sediminis]